MIVIFHTVYLFTHYVYSLFSLCALAHFRNKSNVTASDRYKVDSVTDFEEGRGVRFFPQLFVQRYLTVKGVLEDEKWKGKIKKVVDFGCAEFGFFLYLKRLKGCNEVLEVDIDEDLLQQHCCHVSPLNSDFISQRNEPLTVYVLQGSVSYPDKCLVGCDAVVCIELIEHLYPDVLEDLPFTIFGFIKPRVAIFTTPNEEFNVLFTDFSGFRHPDHKFEWTRAQFESWANNLVSRYTDYIVSFHGIGQGLPGSEHLGGCSQMAVFERHPSSITSEEIIKPQVEDVIEQYKLVRKCEYPFYVDSRSDRTKIRDQAEYHIHFFARCDDYLVDERPQVPVSLLLPLVEEWTSSVDELVEILKENNWELIKDETGCWKVLYPENPSSSECEDTYSNQSIIDDMNPFEKMGDLDIPNSSHADNSYEEKWDCWDENQSYNNSGVYVNTGIPWGDESDLEESQLKTSKSEPTFNSWDILVNASKNPTTPVSKLNCEAVNSGVLSNVPSEGCPILEKNSVEIISCLPPEAVPLNSQADSSFMNTSFCLTTEIGCSVPKNKKNGCMDCEHLKSSDSHNPENEGESSILSEGKAPTRLFPDSAGKTFDHKSNSSSHVDVHSRLLKCVNSNLCLNLQLEGLNAVSSDTCKKIEGLSESPVACSFSLEEANDRQVDSGYPNSTSAQDMDLDLTPEQVDELFTENDVMTDQPPDQNLDSISVSSKGSDSVSEQQLEPPEPNPPVIVPHPEMLFEEDMNVENGDVANNNRDGEGNNAVAPLPQHLDGLEANDNNAGVGGGVLPENFDLIPLIAAAEDLDNDNEIELNVVEPFPPWLLNLLGLANGGVGGRDQGVYHDHEQSSDDDSDNNIDPIDEGLGDDDNFDSNSSVSDTCGTDIGLNIDASEDPVNSQQK